MNPPMYRELTLRDFVQAFQRRKNIFLGAVAGCLLLGVLVCIVSPRKYEATGTIELDTPLANGLDRGSLTGGAPSTADAMTVDVAIQTQAKILQSDELALRTISALHLANTLQGTTKSAPTSGNQAEMKALAVFRNSLTVKPVAGTKLVQITFTSKDPKVAAAVVNELVSQLTKFSEERMSASTSEATQVLTGQMEGLRSQSENLQKQVAAMQSQTGLYEQNTGDGRSDGQAYSAILSQFQRAAATLSDATQNRILKDSIYNVAKTGDPEMISSLAGNSIGGSSSGLANSLGTIENLRVSESQMQTQLDQLRVKFGPDYPKVMELQAGIASAEKSIKAETQRIKERAQTDATIADQTWKSAQDNYDQLKSQADALNSKTVNYRITQQEADESRTLYVDLMKRLKEAGIIQGLNSTNVALVDKAVVPRLPSRPIVPLYLAASLGLGIFLGIFAVAAMELMDDRIYDYVSVEEMGLRIAGVVPHLLGGDGITVGNGVLGIYHNAVRTVRSRVTDSRSKAGTIVAVVPVTPHENSRQLALSITGNASQSGQRVLFIEANTEVQGGRTLKAGQEKLKAGDAAPLVEKSLGKKSPSICHISSELTLTGLPITQDSNHLRDRMDEWRKQYDVIVIDASAQLFDADAAALCENADAVLQVATYGVTTKTALRRSVALLNQRESRNVSVIIQGVPLKSAAFTNYYGCAPALSNA